MNPSNGNGAKRLLDVSISQIADEGCDVKTFRLALAEGADFSFRPGQFVLVSFPDDPDDRRPFSIASSPLASGYIEIAVGRHGRLAEKLFALSGGEKLLITRAQGVWQFNDEHKHAVLVSAGAGIAPLRSMIRYVLDKGLPNKLALFYSERKPSCILYRQELKEFEEQGVSVFTKVAETEAPEEGEPWDGPTGELSGKDIRAGLKDPKSAVYYICGPNKFVGGISADLEKSGIPADAIKPSKWGDF